MRTTVTIDYIQWLVFLRVKVSYKEVFCFSFVRPTYFHHKSFKKLVRFDESQVGNLFIYLAMIISNQIPLTVLNKQYWFHSSNHKNVCPSDISTFIVFSVCCSQFQHQHTSFGHVNVYFCFDLHEYTALLFSNFEAAWKQLKTKQLCCSD